MADKHRASRDHLSISGNPLTSSREGTSADSVSFVAEYLRPCSE